MELVGAKPLHLLTQTVPSLKSPTGAFIASQTLIFRRKQIIRTHLLSETSSDYFCLVRVDGVELAQALVQIDRHALVHSKGAHTAGGMPHIGFHLIFPLPHSYSVMAQTRAGRPVAPSMRG